MFVDGNPQVDILSWGCTAMHTQPSEWHVNAHCRSSFKGRRANAIKVIPVHGPCTAAVQCVIYASNNLLPIFPNEQG